MKNALVINPYITDFKLYDEWMHPLGLYFLIDTLMRQGFSVEYFNCQSRILTRKYGTGCLAFKELPKPHLYHHISRKYKQYGIEETEFKRYLQNITKPDLICVGSMMTYWAPGVLRTVDIIREIFPDVPLAIGGIAARLIPEYFQKNLRNIFINEIPGFNDFLKTDQYLNKEQITLLPGLKTVKNPLPHGPLLLSVGCPMRCTYCASSVLQPRYYKRSLQIVLNELDYMVNSLGIQDFAFYDDALLISKDEVLLPFLK